MYNVDCSVFFFKQMGKYMRKLVKEILGEKTVEGCPSRVGATRALLGRNLLSRDKNNFFFFLNKMTANILVFSIILVSYTLLLRTKILMLICYQLPDIILFGFI